MKKDPPNIHVSVRDQTAEFRANKSWGNLDLRFLVLNTTIFVGTYSRSWGKDVETLSGLRRFLRENLQTRQIDNFWAQSEANPANWVQNWSPDHSYSIKEAGFVCLPLCPTDNHICAGLCDRQTPMFVLVFETERKIPKIEPYGLWMLWVHCSHRWGVLFEIWRN